MGSPITVYNKGCFLLVKRKSAGAITAHGGCWLAGLLPARPWAQGQGLAYISQTSSAPPC
jgi:hypothetical protein